MARLNQIAVGFAGHCGPEEGTGLGAGKVYWDELFLGFNWLNLNLIVFVHKDGGVGMALCDFSQELSFQTFVGIVIVVVIRNIVLLRNVVVLFLGLLDLLGLLLVPEQSGDRFQDLLQFVNRRGLQQLHVVVFVFVDAVVAVSNVVSVGMHLH